MANRHGSADDFMDAFLTSPGTPAQLRDPLTVLWEELKALRVRVAALEEGRADEKRERQRARDK